MFCFGLVFGFLGGFGFGLGQVGCGHRFGLNFVLGIRFGFVFGFLGEFG